MKKVLLITLLAMMLLSMLAMSACKPKPADEPMTEEMAPVDEVAPMDTVMTDVPADTPVVTP